jgi:hypothetical protein
MKSLCLVVFSAFCLTLIASLSWAQSQTSTLPLGTVSDVNRLPGCPYDHASGATCYSGTVSCPNTVNIGFTYADILPGGTPRGTIVLLSGGLGTKLGMEAQYAPVYVAAGFETVLVTWDQAWEITGTTPSSKVAACRPATLLNFLHQTVYRRGGMCAQGSSAGSAAVAYSLAEYGAGKYLDNVELLSGPVLSDIAEGCNGQSRAMMVCASGCNTGRPPQGGWSDSPQYDAGARHWIDSWSGVSGANACVTGDASKVQSDAWKRMSIVDGMDDSTFHYPQTAMAGWVCSDTSVHCTGWQCQNNSAAQGVLFYQNITDPVAPFTVHRINRCFGSEGVSVGYMPPPNESQTAFDAIVSDMTNNCTLRH